MADNDEELLAEMEAEEAEEAAKSAAQYAPVDATAPKRSQPMQFVSDKPKPTVEGVMAKIKVALAAPYDAAKALDEALKDAEKALRDSRSDLSKAIGAAVSEADTDDLFIINTKAVKTDELLKLVSDMRVKLAESGLMSLAKSFSTKSSLLEKGINKIMTMVNRLRKAS